MKPLGLSIPRHFAWAVASAIALAGSGALQAADPVLAPGGVLQRFKQYTAAPTVATTQTDILGGSYDSETIEPYFEFGPNGSNEAGSNYGNVLNGWLVPPVSGDYVFYVSGDDNINLYLSTDADPANKKLIAREPEWNNARDWTVLDRRNTTAPENRSDTFAGTEWGAQITLTAGQQYYIEAVHQEGGGGDSVGVNWRTPLDSADPANGSKPIQGRFIWNYVDTDLASVNITTQPSDASGVELGDASFTVAATGWKGVNIQWEKAPAGGNDFSEIWGATDATLNLRKLSIADNGAKFRAVAYTFGAKKVSSAATLTVASGVAPTVVSAVGSPSLTDFTVVFSKPMDPTTAAAAGNYTADGGLSIIAAEIVSDNTVKLTTSLQTEGQLYHIGIAGVKDASTSGLPVPVGTVVNAVAWKLYTGGVKHEFWQGADSLVKAHAAIDNGTTPTFISVEPAAEYGPNGSNEAGSNYGNRLSGWFKAPQDGDYTFYVSGDDNIELYLSIDANPANKKLIAREPSWNNARDWTVTDRRNATFPENRSDTFQGTEWEGGAIITLTANSIYYFEAIHQEGGGGDSVGVTFSIAGEDPPARGSAPRLDGSNVGIYLNPESIYLDITGQPKSQTVEELATVTLSVQAAAPFRINYQWQKAAPGTEVFEDIVGATAASLKLVDVGLADGGSKYRCNLTTFGVAKTSDAAVITVSADKSSPSLSCTAAGGGLSTVFLTFSERVDQASAENIANYSIDGGVTVQSALLGGNRNKVILTTSPLTAGSSYHVTVNGVKDISSAANTIANNSSTTVLAEPASYSDAILADEPIVYYNFNDASDAATTANLGSKGTDADGTYNGTFVIGDEGPRPPEFVGFGSDNGAPTFNGTDTYVSTGGNWLNALPAFSLEYWVYPDAFTAGRVGIVGQNDAIEYGFINPNTIQIWTPNGGSLDTTYSFDRNTWHHVASVGTGTELQTYFDGVLINKTSATTASYGSSGFKVNIGGGGVFDGSGNWFAGRIDEVAIFDKAVTAEQVRNHYLAAKEGPSPKPRIVGVGLKSGNFVIDWVCGGTLQKASSLNGPWADVDGASSPYATSASGAEAYFRLRQ